MSDSKNRRFAKNDGNIVKPEILAEGVLKGDRSLLARSITLIESNAEQHFKPAQDLLHMILPKSGQSVRIGITGVPGAGKSTFIEAFGMFLCEAGHRVAVLAVDPSSTLNGGSILGDKTRMEELSKHPNAFIRPSPSGGKLGGVHRKTRETIYLCEAAGYDVILVETVGVGQSEVLIREMVDFFMLLVLTGAGDDLQGMKKGILELADAIVVNKADGENSEKALQTKYDYESILHFLQPATKGWNTKACTCSALEKKGIEDIWLLVEKFVEVGNASGAFKDRRTTQLRNWIYSMIEDQLLFNFFQNPRIKAILPEVEKEVLEGEITPSNGVKKLFEYFHL